MMKLNKQESKTKKQNNVLNVFGCPRSTVKNKIEFLRKLLIKKQVKCI